jgi:hypothetical protein
MGLFSLITGQLEQWNWDATSLTTGNTDASDGVATPAAAKLPVTASVPVTGSTGKSTAGAGAPDQSLKTFSSSGGTSIASGANVALYTVTAGKTFYLTDVVVTGNAATAGQVLVQLKAGSTVIWEAYMKTDTQPIEVPGMETQAQAAGGLALSLVIGTLSGGTAAYYIAGFEQ